jgi:outer membrane protein OmpA-like peptidoglycan-associated protein
MTEIGVGAGNFIISGDVARQPGYGFGMHVRKSLDYVFSIRADGVFGTAKGRSGSILDDNLSMYETNFLAGTAYGVISANSLRWLQSTRKFNLYAFVGIGGSFFKPKVNIRSASDILQDTSFFFTPHVATGAGCAFRINSRLNIGLEHHFFFPFGSLGDQLDGYVNQASGNRTNTKDMPGFTCLKVNINMGNPTRLSEPLYWVNPLESVFEELENIKGLQESTVKDSDNDGVIDAIDVEPNTPTNALVDTKGRTLDSDQDGVPDYLDREPYFPLREGEKVNEYGVVVNPIKLTGSGISEERVRDIIAQELQHFQIRNTEHNDPALRRSQNLGWFLPMIHFGRNSSQIKFSDYGTLASIAKMMKANPTIKLVVRGFTDASSQKEYNDNLSYLRAKEIIDHFVINHGIGRGRLILQWRGERDLLVPDQKSVMNRRVEFLLATPGDIEMDPPETLNTNPSERNYGY